jgi:hypothetical protein
MVIGLSQNRIIVILGVGIIITVVLLQVMYAKNAFFNEIIKREGFVDDPATIATCLANIPSNVERVSDTIQQDRKPTMGYIERNILIHKWFRDVCFSGMTDINNFPLSFKEFKSKVMFYPFQLNHDLLCAMCFEQSNSLKDGRDSICKSFNIDSYAIRDQKNNPQFQQNIFQFEAEDSFTRNSSYLLIDNNFYNLYKNTTRIKVANLTATDRTPKTIGMNIVEHSEWFVLSKPVLIYVHMVGIFRVVYDYNISTNIMNSYQSEQFRNAKGSLSETSAIVQYYLFLEIVDEFIDVGNNVLKPVLSQTPLVRADFTTNNLSQLADKINANMIYVYYLKICREIPLVPPQYFASICSFYVQNINDLSSISLGTGTITVPSTLDMTSYITTINVVTSFTTNVGSNPTVGLKVVGLTNEPMFSDQRLNELMSVYTFEGLIITFAFNVITFFLFYTIPNTPEKQIYICRKPINGDSVAGKIFAINRNITPPRNTIIRYDLPNYLDISTRLNIV